MGLYGYDISIQFMFGDSSSPGTMNFYFIRTNMQSPYLSDPNYNIILDNLQSLTGILYSIAYFCAFETRSGARTTADGAENADHQN